jgi:hypothetical protein
MAGSKLVRPNLSTEKATFGNMPKGYLPIRRRAGAAPSGPQHLAPKYERMNTTRSRSRGVGINPAPIGGARFTRLRRAFTLRLPLPSMRIAFHRMIASKLVCAVSTDRTIGCNPFLLSDSPSNWGGTASDSYLARTSLCRHRRPPFLPQTSSCRSHYRRARHALPRGAHA